MVACSCIAYSAKCEESSAKGEVNSAKGKEIAQKGKGITAVTDGNSLGFTVVVPAMQLIAARCCKSQSLIVF